MTLTSSRLHEKTGASYRQIDYWCNKGIISPIGDPSPGSGNPRKFDEKDVEKIKFLVRISKILQSSFHESLLKKLSEQYADGFMDLGPGVRLVWTTQEDERFIHK